MHLESTVNEVPEVLSVQTDDYVDLNWSPFTRAGTTLQTAMSELLRELCPNDTTDVAWWVNGSQATGDVHDFAQTNDLCVDNFLLFVVSSEGVRSEPDANLHLAMKNKVHGWCIEHGIQVARSDCVAVGYTDVKPNGQPVSERNMRWSTQAKNAIQAYKKRHPLEPTGSYRLHHFKVATPDVDLCQLYRAFTVGAGSLQAIDAYFQDIDFMCDYACTVTPEVIRRMQAVVTGSRARCSQAHGRYINSYQANSNDTRDEVYHIENSAYVGNNCYTYLFCSSGNVTRAKIYNKFVQTLESASVRSCVGSHLLDWMNNEGSQLRNSIAHPFAQNRGLSRIEVTFYNEIPSIQTVKEWMHRMEQYFLPGCNFTPIETQWRMMDSILKASTLLYDCQQGALYCARWTNKKTGKTNGWVNTNVKRPNTIEELLKRGTFNGLPIHLFMVDYSKQTKTTDGYIRETPHNGFNFNAASKPTIKSHDNDKNVKRRQWKVSVMSFKRVGPFHGTLLVPRGNPYYKNRSSCPAPDQSGLVDLQSCRLLVSPCKWINKQLRESCLQPTQNECTPRLEVLRNYGTSLQLYFPAELVQKRLAAREKERLRGRARRRVAINTTHIERGSKSLSILDPGDYHVLQSKVFTYRGEDRTALRLEETPDNTFYASHNAHDILGRHATPYVIRIHGKRMYKRKARALISVIR